MRFSLFVASALAAGAFGCGLEASPANVDRLLRHRALQRDVGEPLYTLEFSDGTTRQVTDGERWELKRVGHLVPLKSPG
jgi:bacterial leucyl aminopeptidase